MKSESGRLIPLAKDEKMRAENGLIKGDLNKRTKQFALNIVALILSCREEETPKCSAVEIWYLRGSTLSGGPTSQVQSRVH